MPASPTQRALARARKDGYRAAVVERWNPHARIRQDLFGVIDVLAISPTDTLGIQATSGSNHSKRVAKIRESEEARDWCAAPGRRLEVWSWRKQKIKRGGIAYRWVCRVEEVTP